MELPQPPSAEDIEVFKAWAAAWWAFLVWAAAYVVAGLSLLRKAAVMIEPRLVEAFPPQVGSAFWGKWALALRVLELFSFSGPRDQTAIRALWAWDKKSKSIQSNQEEEGK
jgi:hypothetical protein